MKAFNRAAVRNGKLLLLIVASLSLVPGSVFGQKPGLSAEDRIRISEAIRLGAAVGDSVWNGWGKVPFALMVVTNDYEYLLGHPHATNNFDTLGFDSELKTRVLYRKRLFPTNLLATFPAINGVSTVVVGQSANSGVTSSTAWVLTVLHEHFHQFQQSQPDYFASANALGLSHGDETGTWMLKYPFPYNAPDIEGAYRSMAHALQEAIVCEPADLSSRLNSFLTSLDAFKRILSPDDFKYFSFQSWQEGVARYTEFKVAETAARTFDSGKEFEKLGDFRPYRDAADSIRSGILRGLDEPSLSTLKRTAFYSLGAGEALLLDRVRPGWRGRYFKNIFQLEKEFPR